MKWSGVHQVRFEIPARRLSAPERLHLANRIRLYLNIGYQVQVVRVPKQNTASYCAIVTHYHEGILKYRRGYSLKAKYAVEKTFFLDESTL